MIRSMPFRFITATWMASRADRVLVAKEDVLACLRVIEVDGQDAVDHAEQQVECGLDGLAAPDGRVAVADLLEHFGVGQQHLSRRDGAFEQALRIQLVRVGGADEVHRDVGVEQDHSGAGAR